jgi:hypothetical protein
LIAFFMTWITDDSSYFKTNLPHINFSLFLLCIFIDFENILHIWELIVVRESLKVAHTSLIKGYFFTFAHHIYLFSSKIITQSRVLRGFLPYNRYIFEYLACLYHWFSQSYSFHKERFLLLPSLSHY